MSLGIDLTSAETKPSACVCLSKNLEVIYHGFSYSDSDIIAKIKSLSPNVIAIDSPLSLAPGLCCLNQDCACEASSPLKGRSCEQQLAKLGIPCYFTTKKSIIKKMVERGIRIKRQLDQQGYKVIEVYPYASKVRLFGKPIPKKTTSEGLEWLRKKLSSFLIDTHLDKWNHDLCDAVIAAYTGYLYVYGNAEAVGNESDGFIYIPKSNYGRKESD